MTDTTYMDFSMDLGKDQNQHSHDAADHDEPHLAIQVLSVLAFGIFSIVAVSLAFSAFWLAGLVVTVVLAGIWSGTRFFKPRKKYKHGKPQSFTDLTPPMPQPRSSGNASFDAYRSQTLERLEAESRDFDDFLDRLRDAKGASEFEGFLDDRATEAKRLRDDEYEDAEEAKD